MAQVISLDTLLDLKSLAENRSRFARASLFERVVSLWDSSAAELGADAQGVIDEILIDLAREAESEIKARLVEKLARTALPPMGLMRTLALDEISVAQPVLQFCLGFSEEELMAFAEAGGMAHRRALAQRTDVLPRLGRALARRKEPEVALALVKNAGARLDRGLFGDMLALAKGDERLRDALVQRRDLPKDMAYQMFWWVSAAMRRSILERFSIEPQELDSILREVLRDVAQEEPLAVARSLPRPHDVNGVTGLIQRLKSGDFRGFVQGLAGLCSVSAETAARIVNDPSGEGLAVAVRAIGADRSQFTSIFLQLDFHRYGKARPLSHAQSVSRIFDLVTEARARAALRIWDAQAAA